MELTMEWTKLVLRILERLIFSVETISGEKSGSYDRKEKARPKAAR